MLQRAASNAYSWWWASHIRTKQSKWMEQNLQDMEEKVQAVLKLLEEEGDSFAKRAEMYYKRRPELISFVEESFRAYRSLADRYDHISTELQNANNTIASVCPDQVPYMEEDDGDSPRPRSPKNMPEVKEPIPQNIPKVPKPPLRDLKSVIKTANEKFNPKKVASRATAPKPKVQKSGLSRKEALAEVDKLQKEILSLQTVKEFVKSSYDNAIARYRDTENQIKGLQEKVSNLQDEVGEGVVAIDDEEARCLMAASALKSCQDTLSQLELKQTISLDETNIETKRVREARDKLSSLMNECDYDQTNSKEPRAKRDVKEIAGTNDMEEDVHKINQHRQELQLLQEKIKEHFAAGSYSTLTVQDMAEKIDTLVTKVISLETAVSSQTAMVERLKVETDDLNTVVKTLEGDKGVLINDKAKLNEQLREMDEKLREVQDLNQIVEDQNTNLQTHFTEAHCNLDHLSEKVQKVKPDLVAEISLTERNSSREAESEHDPKVLLNDEKSNEEHKVTAEVEDTVNSDTKLKVADVTNDGVIQDNNSKVTGSKENDVKATNSVEMDEETPVENKSSIELKERDQSQDSSYSDVSQGDSQEHRVTKEDEPNWQELLNGMQERENALLLEYTNALQNYDAMKIKVSEIEKKNQDVLFESSLQLKELKTSNALKDEEIRLLRLKLGALHKNLEGKEELAALASVQPPPSEKNDIKEFLEEPESTISAIEERFRMGIDELLEENLEFWMKFSTSFTGIHKFETTIKDLVSEVKRIEQKCKSSEGSNSAKYNLKSDARPIYKHLSEILNELSNWLEDSALLKEELQCRFSNLCEIQEEITTALKASAEDDDFKFTSYQAAKFQGEVLNMKQENNRVADELQAGLDLVTTLQLDGEKALAKLNERFGISTCKKPQRPSNSHSSTVPLRSFIFGVKPKKQKQSIFTCMTPGMNRKYRGYRG